MVTKEIETGGGTAFAILSGELFEERAGALLFATNTSALRDIPVVGGARPVNRYHAKITSR